MRNGRIVSVQAGSGIIGSMKGTKVLWDTGIRASDIPSDICVVHRLGSVESKPYDTSFEQTAIDTIIATLHTVEVDSANTIL